MTSPQVGVALLAAGVGALQDQARSLGLTWELRPATVVAASTGITTATYDGDSVPVDMISLVGTLAVGARVMAIFIPPAGNYVVGLPTFGLATAVRQFVQAIFTTTSTTYATGTVCGVAFVAPPSGKVMIRWSAELHHGTSFILVSPQVRTGSTVNAGTIVTTPVDWTANDDRTVRNDNALDVRSSDQDLMYSLVPGSSYNVTLLHRVGALTGTIGRRRITVTPTS